MRFKYKSHPVFLLISVIVNYCNSSTIDHERILTWWKEISVTKPMKCKVNSDYLKPFPENIAKHIVQGEETHTSIVHTRPCQENEDFIFDFKGQIINNKFDGAGRLKITRKEPKQEIENEACASRGQYKGKLARSVVGTFKNGSFHGPGKVIFEDGSSIISDFRNGTPAGLTRSFTSNGKLSQIFYEDIMIKGYKWTNLHHKYLFYTDVSSFFNNHNDTISEIAVPICRYM